MTAALHVQMHQCHRQTLSEDALLLDQVAEWQAELAKLMSELPQIEAALRDHAEALENHAAAIAADDLQVDAHEAAVADYERGGTGERLIEMAPSHEATGCRHRTQQAAHERIRRHHYGFCTKWNLLRKALGEAM